MATRISSNGATDIDNLAKNTSFSSISPIPIKIATSSAVNGTTNVTTAPAAPVTDFALDEILEHQNRFTHPKFRIGSTLG